MKRFALLFATLLVFGIGMGQSNKVQTAYSLMKPEYNELDKAKEAIDEAAQHPKTSGEAKTWYYRGLLYYKLYQSKDEKFKNLDPNPLKVAYQSLVKAKELDVKNRYSEDLLFRLTMAASEFFNKGSAEFENKKYANALESFETAMAIGRLPYINQLDTGAFFNAAISADQAGLYDKALEYYKKSAEYNWGGSEIFYYIAEVQKAKGDTIAALDSYKAGISKYPDSSIQLYINLINYYLTQGDIEAAYTFVEKAIEKEKSNPSLWFVYGLALEKKDLDRAVEAYSKTVELDPTYFDAYFNMGTLYFNLAVEANTEAGNVPLDDQAGYKIAVAKTDDLFHKALPYYEKAYTLKDVDQQLLTGLRQIYYRFKMNEKLDEVQKKIDNMK